MWVPDIYKLRSALSEHFGIQFQAIQIPSKDGTMIIEIAPSGDASRLFQIQISIGWRSLKAELLFGMFSSQLIESIVDHISVTGQLFGSLAQKNISEGVTIIFNINGVPESPFKLESWPNVWKKFELSAEKKPIAVNTEDFETNNLNLDYWSKSFVTLILSILPQEELEETETVSGLPEGSVSQIKVNKYERSHINRAMCIELQGTDCKICKFSFQHVYGDIGKNFIHVHHITPLSKLGPNYIINPVTDLVPLCPNCHAMAHKKNPPFTMEELIKIYADHSSALG
ncbi:MAG: HNH endonuclease [Bacteroidota bacterium]|nr:HNH endonuclease [Bacteroidota bacterium]